MPLLKYAESRGITYSARTHATIFAIEILVPALLFAGWMATRSVNLERAQIEKSAHARAQEIAASIDHEIKSKRGVLITMATSNYLQDGEIENFSRKARLVAGKLNVQFVLNDAEKNVQLLNTAFPNTDGLLPGAPYTLAAQSEATKLRRPAITNIFLAPNLKEHIAVMTAPFYRGDRLAYFVSISLRADEILALLPKPDFSFPSTISVIDNERQIVARFPKHAEFVGKKIGSTSSYPTDNNGVIKTINLEGATTYLFYARSGETGWRVFIGIPESVLDSPSHVAMLSFGAAVILFLVGAILIASRFGGKVSDAIVAVKYAANRYSNSAQPVPTSSVLEANDASKEVSISTSMLWAQSNQGSLAVRAAEIGIWDFNVLQDTLTWSDRYRDILGIEKGVTATRALFLSRIHVEDREMINEAVRRSLEADVPYDLEYRVLPNDKSAQRWISVRAHVERDIAGRAIRMQGIVQDISAKKNATLERDELRRTMLSAQERERARLARELHDQAGQDLVAVTLQLKTLEKTVAGPTQLHIRQLRNRIDVMGETLHRVAWELRPASISELGLSKAIAHYVSGWTEKSGIQVDFNCGSSEIDTLPDDILTTLYRIVQEALTNVVKHAIGARSVSVVLTCRAKEVRLAIEDDGCGFDSDLLSSTSTNRLGLAGMRERLSLVDGEIEIESTIGRGTTVFVKIAVQDSSAAA